MPCLYHNNTYMCGTVNSSNLSDKTYFHVKIQCALNCIIHEAIASPIMQKLLFTHIS